MSSDGPAAPGRPAVRRTFWTDLQRVLAERDFRRLFATRLVSQAGDGAFTAGLGTYVFFTQGSFPNPGAAAAAFAVLYLPYSLIGPFAGVFIDRWSRRQIVVWSALLRAGFVVLTAALVGFGSLGTPLYVSVLAVLGVNRFFLSSLSAALPHVVAEDTLVMANSVAPTVGTVVAFLGGFAGLIVHVVGGRSGSAVTLLAAGACYLLAGAVGATMRRDLLGPPPLPSGAERAAIHTELMIVVRGLASGAKHAWERRPVTAALAVTGAQRAWFGVLLLTAILLYRNYFYVTSTANRSLGHFTLLVIAAAIGFGLAAVVTPLATRRMSKTAWMVLLLAVGGLVTALLGPTFQQAAFLVIGTVLGLAAQGVAICAITIIQQRMDDSYRGRVFALYDMLFNLPFVLAAAVAAQFLPDNGKSYPVILAVAAGYLVSASAYALASRQELLAGPSDGEPSAPLPGDAGPPAPPGNGSPSAAAQRSNS